jgi:hypothetical protein
MSEPENHETPLSKEVDAMFKDWWTITGKNFQKEEFHHAFLMGFLCGYDSAERKEIRNQLRMTTVVLESKP